MLDRTVRRVRNLAHDIDVNDVLDTLGLQKQRSVFAYIVPAVGILGAGILVGAGLGLLFAPSSGKSLRHEAESKVNDIKERIRHTNVIAAATNHEPVRDFANDSSAFDTSSSVNHTI
jgi:hypothetical protein